MESSILFYSRQQVEASLTVVSIRVSMEDPDQDFCESLEAVLCSEIHIFQKSQFIRFHTFWSENCQFSLNISSRYCFRILVRNGTHRALFPCSFGTSVSAANLWVSGFFSASAGFDGVGLAGLLPVPQTASVPSALCLHRRRRFSYLCVFPWDTACFVSHSCKKFLLFL